MHIDLVLSVGVWRFAPLEDDSGPPVDDGALGPAEHIELAALDVDLQKVDAAAEG